MSPAPPVPAPQSSSLPIRQKLIDIAAAEIGTTETGRNTGKRIIEYQRATTLTGTGWPYCAAFVCWCIRQWGKDQQVLAHLQKTPAEFEAWRPKTAAAFGFEDWAHQRRLQTFDDNPSHQLRSGDLIVFDMSHIGLVTGDRGDQLQTIEGNTGATGSRDGEGVWSKTRHRREARTFIRILPP